MKKLEHLTQVEIYGYNNHNSGKPTTPETQRIGKHLLFCQICRESIPVPTIDQLKTAIFIDNNIAVIETKSKNEKSDSLVFPDASRIREFWRRPIAFAHTFGALVVVFGTLFSIWMISTPLQNTIVTLTDNEIQLLTPIEHVPISIDSRLNNGVSPKVKSEKKQNRKTSANNELVKLTTDLPIQELLKTNSLKETAPKKINRIQNTSEVRGNEVNCYEERLFESEFSLKDANIVFTWKKIPNAKTYHLYISDDSEILIDEFETENETSFVSKKSLDPSKSYKWKIVATLENGQVVVGPSLKVTSKELQKNKMKLKKSKETQIRCSKNG